jgi:hypothetical protein
MFIQFILLILICIIGSESITYYNGCVNQCAFSDNGGGNCITQVSPMSNNYECNPVFIQKCPNGCKSDGPGHYCVNNHFVPPSSYSIRCPLCGRLSSDKSNCGNYIPTPPYCPYNCKYNSQTNSCDPTEGNVCGSTIGWKCPHSCSYNSEKHTCDPLLSIYVCSLDKSVTPYRCPNDCTYDHKRQKCIGNICELTPITILPINCTGSCFPNRGKYEYPCSFVDPHCSHGCSFNKTTNSCMPDSDNVCETTIVASCPDKYEFSKTIPECNKYNRNGICRLNDNVQYPSSLDKKYQNIQCQFKTDIDCASMTATIETCPQGCVLDELLNKCVNRNDPSYICGSVNILCPSNYVQDNTGQCHPVGRNEPLCPDKYMLKYIINTHSVSVAKCFPKWYYN